jgi:hypothetical protein
VAVTVLTDRGLFEMFKSWVALAVVVERQWRIWMINSTWAVEAVSRYKYSVRSKRIPSLKRMRWAADSSNPIKILRRIWKADKSRSFEDKESGGQGEVKLWIQFFITSTTPWTRRTSALCFPLLSDNRTAHMACTTAVSELLVISDNRSHMPVRTAKIARQQDVWRETSCWELRAKSMSWEYDGSKRAADEAEAPEETGGLRVSSREEIKATAPITVSPEEIGASELATSDRNRLTIGDCWETI